GVLIRQHWKTVIDFEDNMKESLTKLLGAEKAKAAFPFVFSYSKADRRFFSLASIYAAPDGIKIGYLPTAAFKQVVQAAYPGGRGRCSLGWKNDDVGKVANAIAVAEAEVRFPTGDSSLVEKRQTYTASRTKELIPLLEKQYPYSAPQTPEDYLH